MAGKGGVAGSTLRTSRAILEELSPLLVRDVASGHWSVTPGPELDRLAPEIAKRWRTGGG